MDLVTVIGARPQFVKLWPVCRAIDVLKRRNPALRHRIIHTGQHYSKGMSDVFFAELDLPAPDANLGVGSGTHGAQTGRMLEGIEALLLEWRPDALVVVGDTNSTAAGALAAAKLGIPVAHIEAGLRSFNRAMPEELNRIVTDHLSDLLLAPTEAAMQNLAVEGLAARAVRTGDVSRDAVEAALALAARHADVPGRFGLTERAYAVATVHRQENTDTDNLRLIAEGLNRVARGGLPVLFPIHPRTSDRLARMPGVRLDPKVQVVEPLGYLEMIKAVASAAVVLTDSGGLQKEAFFLGCPCVTLRTETEWIETVTEGGNIVTGADPEKIEAAVRRWSESRNVDFAAAADRAFGERGAAMRSVEKIIELVEQRRRGGDARPAQRAATKSG